MTVLSACRTAARRLNQDIPTSLYGSDDEFALELANIADESATAIAKSYDWQKLTTLCTLTGDGVTTAFSLPADYDRMPKKTTLQVPFQTNNPIRARDLDQWLYYQLNPQMGVPPYWIILGGLVQFSIAPATGVDTKFYYVKNTVVTGASSAQQVTFTADTDYFNLPERLLTLDVIWRWRSQKGLDYAEPMRNFEIAMEQEIANDKGSRILTVGSVRMPIDVEVAHPAVIV